MDYLGKFIAQVRNRLAVAVLIGNGLVILGWWLAQQYLKLNTAEVLLVMGCASLLGIILLPWITSRFVTRPTRLIWQAILHIAPDVPNVPPPDIRQRGAGHELVTYLTSQIYQLANVADELANTNANARPNLTNEFVANSIPLPLMVLDKNRTVLFANNSMCTYIEQPQKDVIGQNLYSVLDMSFNSDKTFDSWLKKTKTKAPVASKTWERVRIEVGEHGTRRQFDLVAYYNKNNPNDFETMLVFFDRTKRYNQDDQALNFVALAVHELRTPVTLLRGYIEALEEDLEGKLDEETAGFMRKMRASAQSLSSFINNMLNVARVESNQLVLELHEEKWPGIVQSAVNDLSLRAKIRGVELSAHINNELPTVGVDRAGVYEVLINLIDNAIKYSKPGQKVIIEAHLTRDGMVETSVKDSGVGIPANVIPNLFEKYYRSHRSRDKAGGTGLGLFLCKSIIDAHGGKIWVRSREGEGSTFGFTLHPYANLTEEQKKGENKGITRSAHGWIKNHSLYSR